MLRFKILPTSLALIALAAISATTSAASRGWYAGVGYGTSSLNHGVGDFSGGSVSGVQIDDSDTAWKIFGGRQLTERLSIEAGYVDLNNDVDDATTFSGSSDGSGTEFSEGPVNVDLDEPRAAAVTLVGTLPLTERAKLLAKLGAAAWTVDRTTSDAAGISTRSESGVAATFGAGFQYRVGRRVELRLDLERYADIAGGDVDLGSVGVLVRLGKRSR